MGQPPRTRNAVYDTMIAVAVVVNVVLGYHYFAAQSQDLRADNLWRQLAASAVPLLQRGVLPPASPPLIALGGGILDAETVRALEESAGACPDCTFLLPQQALGQHPVLDSSLSDRVFLLPRIPEELWTVAGIPTSILDPWFAVSEGGQVRYRGTVRNLGFEVAAGLLAGTRRSLNSDDLTSDLRRVVASSWSGLNYCVAAGAPANELCEVLFVDSVSASCWTGVVVDGLSRRSGDSTTYASQPLVAVPRHWTSADIAAFRSAFRITASTVTMPQEIETQWRFWKRRYGAAAIPFFLVEFRADDVGRVVLPEEALAAR